MYVERERVIVLQLKYRKVLRWLRENPISWLLLFFLFFLISESCVICFRYKKPYAARAMKRKKPISHNNRPLHLLIGKIKHPKNHRKSPPRLAPKILIPQTPKETIHRNVQVERRKLFGRLPRTKESFAKASKHGPEGEDSDRAFL